MPTVSGRTVSTRDASTRSIVPTTNAGATSTRTLSTTGVPSTRTTSGRAVTDVPIGQAATQSDLEAISNRILGNVSNYNYLTDALRPFGNINSLFAGSTQANPANGNTTVDTNNPQTTAPIYGTGNPFDVLGDAFTKAFGGSTYNPQPQQPSTIVQPVGTSGGGSPIAIILILGAIGVGVWYWYKKHHGG